MKIANFLSSCAISTDLQSAGKLEVLFEMGALLAKAETFLNEHEITSALVDRERLATTGIGNGVAIPHAKIANLKTIVAAVGISKPGIPFDSVDNKPVNLFFVLLAPHGSASDHLKALAKISRLFKAPGFIKRLLEAKDNNEAFDIIIEEDGKY